VNSTEWQIATQRRRKEWPEPRVYVSVNKRGEIAMNAAAFKLIREPANVTLMYLPHGDASAASAKQGEFERTTPSPDKTHREPPLLRKEGSFGAIGIKFPVTEDRHFFPVRRYGRGRKMRIVRGRRLLQQFGIEITDTLRFVNPQVVKFNGHPMIVLPLSDE
jgi:hypothetical protein